MAQRGTVLVLGGSSGIGEATVRRLAADAVPVLFTHRTGVDRAQRICAELGDGVRTVHCDVREPESLAAAFAAAGAGLTGVVHCVGAWTYTRLAELTLDELDDAWAMNGRSVVLALQHAGRLLPEGGAVVVVSSVAAELAPARQASYVMTKAAAEAATRVAAKELGRQGIRAVVVRPGATDTPQLRSGTSEKAIEAMAGAPALRRLGAPDDLAGVIAFLLGPDARWVTGTVVEATGGLR